jgi:hypothetical protein
LALEAPSHEAGVVLRENMDKNCPVCLGLGWVCENHPDRAWSDEFGCMCGAGMPCECNSAGEPGVDEPDVSEVLIEANDISKH